MWIYRRSLLKPLNAHTSSQVLLRGRQVWWRPVQPAGIHFRDVALPELSASDAVASATQSAFADALQREMREVARLMLDDFLKHFTHREGPHP